MGNYITIIFFIRLLLTIENSVGLGLLRMDKAVCLTQETMDQLWETIITHLGLTFWHKNVIYNNSLRPSDA